MLATAVGLLPPGPAPDQPGELRWDAAVGCPSEAEMRDRIAQAGGTGGLRIEAAPTRQADGRWRLELAIELDGNEDRRALEGRSCAALADALELLIAVRRDNAATPAADDTPTSDAALGAGIPYPDPPTAADVDLRESAELPAVSRPDPAIATRIPDRTDIGPLPLGLLIAAAGGLGVGSTPWPAFPVEVAFGWSAPRLRLAARGRYFVPRRVDIDGDRGAVIQLGTVGVEACARFAVRAVEFPLCGQSSIGGSRASGRGSRVRDRGGIWVEAGIDVGLAWRLAPQWALTARIGGAAVLTSSRYVIDGARLFDPPPGVGRFVLGVEAHIPIQIGRRPEKG